jgi:hypothetical protein
LLIYLICIVVVIYFIWFFFVPAPIPVDCKDGTSVNLDDYNCSYNTLTLTIKNNGGFNISGVLIKVSNDTRGDPVILLQPDSDGGTLAGLYQLFPDLQPGEVKNVNFIYNNSQISIKKISYQPYINMDIRGSRKKVVCQGTVPVIPIVGQGCN